MNASTILTITADTKFLELFRRRLHDQVAGGSPMFVAGTIDEACSVLNTAHPRVIVVHWTRESGSYEQLDRLLWTTSVQTRRIPVLVIAERYRTDQATMMYRMGVSEYISRSHHLDQLGRVFSTYLHLAPPASNTLVSLEQPNKTWSSNHKAGALTTQAV
jgi:DNA-binding NarL/FixJ family response regulator